MSEQIPSDLRALMSELTEEDSARLTPPSLVWAGIASTLEVSAVPDNVSFLRRRGPMVLAAAAAVLVLALVSTAAITAGDSTSSAVVATTIITDEGLPVTGAAPAEARIVERDGQLQLELDVADLPEADGFYEVWLIDTNVEGMFSLGTINGEGTLDVPAGVNPADYPVVDISIEPVDGDPTHSGQSVLRGVLST
jgi:anti-sigma-K factor RskA